MRQSMSMGRSLLLAVLGLLCAACVDVKQEAILALQPGSQVTLSAATLPMPLMSTQEGFIRSTITLNVDIGDVLRGRPIMGTVKVDQILIAGSALVIAPGITTGTLCTGLDPSQPNSGTATINLLRQRAMLSVKSGTLISVTDPTVRGVLAAAADLPVPVAIEATVPINIFDLLGALAGNPLPIKITQPIMQMIPATVPILGGGTIAGQLVLAAVDKAPTSAGIEECKAFQAMR